MTPTKTCIRLWPLSAHAPSTNCNYVMITRSDPYKNVISTRSLQEVTSQEESFMPDISGYIRERVKDLNGVNGGRLTGWACCLTRAGGMWNNYNLVGITPGNHDNYNWLRTHARKEATTSCRFSRESSHLLREVVTVFCFKSPTFPPLWSKN